MRLWCRCGKSCGRLDLRDDVWHYVGRSAWPPTERHPANKLPIAVALSSTEADDLGVTCSSGHWSALNVADAEREARSGRHALTLRPVAQ